MLTKYWYWWRTASKQNNIKYVVLNTWIFITVRVSMFLEHSELTSYCWRLAIT